MLDADGCNPTPYEDDLDLPQEDPAERFLSLLRRIKLAHQHLGVIRSSFLRQTHLLGTYVASDITLLAELTLYGSFYELPERLFFRRLHPTSGSWRRSDASHQAKYYHGVRPKQAKLTAWRGHWGRFSAVRASPLPAASKVKLYRSLSKLMFWDRQRLLTELAQYLVPAAA